MKMHSKELNELCLLWQNQKTRQWYHVANLFLLEDSTYAFSYENKKEKRGLKEAIVNGYHLHPSFPDTEKTYYSKKLFSTFARRLPNKSRQDYVALLELNNLSKESSEFEILAATGGRLISDSYEFVEPIRREGNQFVFEFYARGWRHWNTAGKVINNLNDVYLEVDANNEEDVDAVAVKDREGIIGYVPAFYSEFVKNMLLEDADFKINNVIFDEKAASHNKVKLTISGQVTDKMLNNQEFDLMVTI